MQQHRSIARDLISFLNTFALLLFVVNFFSGMHFKLIRVQPPMIDQHYLKKMAEIIKQSIIKVNSSPLNEIDPETIQQDQSDWPGREVVGP